MFQRRLLLMGACLLLVAALGSSQANAQFETWSGTSSGTLKSTRVNHSTPGNENFVTQSETKSGKVEMYIGPDGPTTNLEGYYLKFIGDDGTIIGFTDAVVIKTQVTKSKSDKVLAVGVGSLFYPGSATGLVFLDASGTVTKNKTGQITAINLTMNLGGGDDPDDVWHCSFKVTLTKK